MTSSRAPLTVQETMQVLGVSEKTVRRLLKRGDLVEHSRMMNRVLITPDSVERVARESGRPPAQPVQGEAVLQPLPPPSELQQVASTFANLIREKDERIYSLQQQLADLEAQQKYLPSLNEAERGQLMSQHRYIEELERRISAYEAQAQPAPPSPGVGPVTGTEEKQGIGAWIRRKLNI